MRHGVEQGPVFFRRIEVAVCRSINHRPVRIKSRAVAGTVPTLLRGIPGNDATQMSTDGGAPMILPVLIPVNGYFCPSTLDDGALAGSNLVYRTHIRVFEPVGKLCADVYVFPGQFRECPQGNA